MPITVDGATFLSFAEKAMQAIEMVPEKHRDFVLWKGSFPGKDGAPEEKKAMTPAEMAADIVAAIPFMTRLAKDGGSFDQASMEAVQAENARIAKLSMKEIAALGREAATAAAREIDALGPIPADSKIKTMRGEMPRSQMAVILVAHVIHHRGQLYSMLRAIGEKPPGFA